MLSGKFLLFLRTGNSEILLVLTQKIPASNNPPMPFLQGFTGSNGEDEESEPQVDKVGFSMCPFAVQMARKARSMATQGSLNGSVPSFTTKG